MKFSIGIKSLLLQLSSFLLTSVVLSVAASFFQFSYSFIVLLFLHACFAASMAFFLRFDFWWVPIQFLFPLSAYFLSHFEISPYIYLLVLIVCSTVFWSTYRTQVPYYPSRTQLLTPILEMLEGREQFKFIDIGSGMGGLVIELSLENKEGTFNGVEVAPLPWLVSVFRAWIRRAPARFSLGDFFRLNLAEFDVVFCYLSPAVMDSVWAKVRAEMQPGSLFLSYEFIVSSVTPDISIQVENQDEYLYGWHM